MLPVRAYGNCLFVKGNAVLRYVHQAMAERFVAIDSSAIPAVAELSCGLASPSGVEFAYVRGEGFFARAAAVR